MNLIIFGATGTLGRVVVVQALEAGHNVTAFTRHSQFKYTQHPNLRVVQGDVLDGQKVEAAIEGHDAVFCALGAGRKGVVRAAGTQSILKGMKAQGVRRLICQTTLGAGNSAGNLNFFWKNIMFGMLLRPAFADHQMQESLIFKSDADWTVVRPAAFTDGSQTGAYKHGFSGASPDGLTLKISRADVAQFMLAQLKSDVYLHSAPGISN